MLFVGIKVVAGMGDKVTDPCDFIDLFAKVGLHQAIWVFAPKRAKGRQLIGA